MTKEEQKEYNNKYYLENKNKINECRAKRRDKINEYSRKYYSQKKQRLAELENKIADIKANCDLAIEGRDIKIKELEQQIEKMKNYLNCENYGKCGNSMGCPCDKWECIEKWN